MMKKPKILSALMVLGLSASLLGQVPVMAEEADQTQTTDAAGGITTNSISGWPQASDISSEGSCSDGEFHQYGALFQECR